MNIHISNLLKQFNVVDYIDHGSQKHVFSTKNPEKVCKLVIETDHGENRLGKLFRELLYRISHPHVCAVPSHIRILSIGEKIVVIWLEEKAIMVGNKSLSAYQFIEETQEELRKGGFRDFHVGNIGRFVKNGEYQWKWIDL